jgi:hypothetical protein
MQHPYRIEPESNRGQSNALRIESISPAPRCVLRPKTWQAVLIRDTRPALVYTDWCHFDYCISGQCTNCRIYQSYSERSRLNEADACVRRADDNTWCLMNHRRKGWASYCYWYPSLPELVSLWAIQIMSAKRDEHGVYYPVASVLSLAESADD